MDGKKRPISGSGGDPAARRRVWASRATPPPLEIRLDLANWLSLEHVRHWQLPVLSPYALRDGAIVGFQGSPERWFGPAEVPWLPTDFAHLAVDLPGEDTETRAVSFADLHGITGEWSSPPGEKGYEPPREVPIEQLLEQARGLRGVLEAWRDLTPYRDAEEYLRGMQSPKTRPALRSRTKSMETFLASVPLPPLEPWSTGAAPREFITPDTNGLRFDFGAGYARPLDLLDVMRLLLAADFTQGLEVRECREITCKKLFIWAEGSRRTRGSQAGRPARFCSRRHAVKAAQRDRRERTKKEG